MPTCTKAVIRTYRNVTVEYLIIKYNKNENYNYLIYIVQYLSKILIKLTFNARRWFKYTIKRSHGTLVPWN